MRPIVEKQRWYFVDEAGDPTFYGKGKKVIVGTEGCSKTFSVGYLRISDPQIIRAKLAEVRLAISTDKYLKPIPSVAKSIVSFHAKDDCPEVRYLVYRALESIEFRAQIVVARKIEPMFKNDFKSSSDAFYDRLVTHLFRNQLHIAEQNIIVFARRNTKSRQHALGNAVQTAVNNFWNKHPDAPHVDVKVGTDEPLQEPALQAADYVLWAVQRAFERREMRYFDCLRDKIQLVWDIFDFSNKKGIYDRDKNPFHIDKTSPLS